LAGEAWTPPRGPSATATLDTPSRTAVEQTLSNKTKGISFAAYAALVDLFPTQQPALRRADGHPRVCHRRLRHLHGGRRRHHRRPGGAGDAGQRDGSNQAGNYADSCVPACYQPVNTPDTISDPNRWQPLRLPNGTVQTFATPHWANVAPFALTSASQFRPDHGPAIAVVKGKPNSDYLKEVDQQLYYSAGLTDTQKVIAQYWEDLPGTETPPGHWCLFAQWLSRRDHHSLDDDAKLFFALGNALLDASITAWDAKRTWDSVRPVTAVHCLKQGQLVQAWGGPYQGTRTIRGEGGIHFDDGDFEARKAGHAPRHTRLPGGQEAIVRLP
jgi:hypothetical protein